MAKMAKKRIRRANNRIELDHAVLVAHHALHHRKQEEMIADLEQQRLALLAAQRRIGHGTNCNDHTECREIRQALEIKE